MDVVSDLDRLIERRSRQNGEERPEEVMHAASVRRYHAQRRRELDAERYRYHLDHADRLRRSMTALVEFHERQAMKLLEGKQ